MKALLPLRVAAVAFAPAAWAQTPAVPVTASPVAVHDVAIVREGLGTVRALNVATIRPQVSGMLEEVAFREGQSIRKGELIARIDPRPLQAAVDEAVATLARDTATLEDARLNLTRTRPLATRGYATGQALDTQSSVVARDESTLRIDEARIEAAKVQLGFTSIGAPFDGTVGIRLVDVGNVVHPGDAGGIVVLTQVEPISVVFPLPSADIPVVQAALARGDVPATAYAADDRTVLDRGTLRLINNQADPTSGTVQLKAQFPNAGNRLWPGTFVNVHVVVGVRRSATTVPHTAVQQGPDGLYVYVVGADDVVRMRTVTVDQSRDGEALVGSGLKGGERVVTDGMYGLTDGARVAVVSGAAARQVQGSTAASAGMLP